MILQEPSDFRGLRFSKNPDILNEISRYIITDYGYLEDRQLVKLKSFVGDHLSLKPVLLYGLTDSEKSIPSFSHPVFNLKNGWVALDLRQMVTVDSATLSVSVRNDSEFQFALKRFVLSAAWRVGKQDLIYGFRFPHMIYGDWLSTAITRKFGLTMGDQVRLAVLAIIYYGSQFVNEFTQEDLDKLKVRLKTEIYTEALVQEVFQVAGAMGSLDDFCAACFKVTNNVRLKGFDFSTLVSVVNNSWFGLNATENTLIALAHPPTWVAMVDCALTQRSFRNSLVAKTVDIRNKRGAGEEFLKELNHVASTYKAD